MSGSVDHVLLTRFNLPSEGVEGLIRAQDGWLHDRVRLFLRYCVPSVEAQTDRRFRWLVYFDEASPEWMRDELDPLIRRGVFVPQYATAVPTSRLVSDIAAAVGEQSHYLLTTNLDNDDGLATDFIARLHAVDPRSEPVAVFLPRGLVRDRDRLFERVDPANAFCSVLEPWTAPLTCWTDWHTLLPSRMPTVTLPGEPAWLQVVHGTNVSNRAQGERVSPERFATRFVGVDDLPEVGALTLFADRVAGGPLRSTRAAVRAAVKWLVMRAAGKSGLDRAKLVLAKRFSRASNPPGAP